MSALPREIVPPAGVFWWASITHTHTHVHARVKKKRENESRRDAQLAGRDRGRQQTDVDRQTEDLRKEIVMRDISLSPPRVLTLGVAPPQVTYVPF